MKPISVPGCSARHHPIAPFPGPRSGTSPESHSQINMSPDPVFSPHDTNSSSDGECKSTNSGTPTPDPEENGFSNLDFPDSSGRRQNGNVRRPVSYVSSSSSEGLNRFAGCTETPAKVEALHSSLAAHLSTILHSEDEAATVASAQ